MSARVHKILYIFDDTFTSNTGTVNNVSYDNGCRVARIYRIILNSVEFLDFRGGKKTNELTRYELIVL